MNRDKTVYTLVVIGVVAGALGLFLSRCVDRRDNIEARIDRMPRGRSLWRSSWIQEDLRQRKELRKKVI